MSLYCICSDHLCAPLLGIFSSLFTSPQLFLFSAPLHASTFPSPLNTFNTFIPVPKKNCKGQKVWRGVSRDGKERELYEVGVMCRITMKGWGVGRSERQMDGEKRHIH